MENIFITKRIVIFLLSPIFAMFLSLAILPSSAKGEERLIYSCSAQIYEAFEKERLDSFTRATGIGVDLYIGSSYIAIERLRNGFAGISSTTNRLGYRLKEEGYIENPFCKDRLAIISNSRCKIKNISKEQLRSIFNREIGNWNEVAGADHPIVLVVPKKTTGAYRNFSALFMKRHAIQYDLLANRSSYVIEVVRNLPYAISFVSYGATANWDGIKVLKIDGLGPSHRDYKYYQVFSYVTKGKPVGAQKKFIDFAFSDKGLELIKKRGLVPLK